ncbi:MAG: L-threonylcarbamoyladenylate synthase [Pelistega sp.]|nr:L-threonylcarbamoyladenylate synthase [Pelistega sp.]
MNIELTPIVKQEIQVAAERLAQGELVAFPTETVYGLGADAENPQAVAQIYQAKGRPQNHPVIVHIAPDADIQYWAAYVPEEAEKLMQAFWPGPLTLILPRAKHIPDAVSGGQTSIGIRCPSHPVAQALLSRFAALKPSGQGGVAAPSANKFGHVSPTLATHVRSEFPKEIAQGMLVLEGGASEVGIESTIIDVSRVAEGIGAVLLRPGHILPEQIAEVIGYMPARPDQAAPRVSGSLKAHYAPNTTLQLIQAEQLEQDIEALVPEGEKWAMLVFQAPAGTAYVKIATSTSADTNRVAGANASADVNKAARTSADENNTSSADTKLDWYQVSDQPAEYAHELYALLHRLDTLAYNRICVQTLPQDSRWEALNDRLQRAAAAFEA